MPLPNKQRLREFVASRHIQVIIKKSFRLNRSSNRKLFEYTEEIKITGNGKYTGQYKSFL